MNNPKLFLRIFCRLNVTPFTNESSKYFDVKVLFYMDHDKMIRSNRKLGTGSIIFNCNLNDGNLFI